MPLKLKRRGKRSISYRKKKGRTRAVGENSSDGFESCMDFFMPDDVGHDSESNKVESNDGCLKIESQETVDIDGCCASEFYLVADKVMKVSPVDDLDAIYRQRTNPSHRYKALLASLRTQAQTIQIQTGFLLLPSDSIQFVQVYASENPAVKCAVSVDPGTFSASVVVHRQSVGNTHNLWKGLPNQFCNCDSIINLLKRVCEFRVCVGNPDPEYFEFPCGDSAFVEKDVDAKCGGISYNQTVRHRECELLVEGFRCSVCSGYRASLRKKQSVHERRKALHGMPGISSKMAHKYMSREELAVKVNLLQNERHMLTAEVNNLKSKLKSANNYNGMLPEKIFTITF